MAKKLEVNIRSLITHCEELVKSEDEKWRLIRYIKSLDVMLKELEEFETVDRKSVSEYHERCQELKIKINYVEPPERVKLKSKSKESTSDGIITEIKQLNNSRYTTELRKELFDGDTNTGLRKRADNESSENMEKYYSNIQEKLADEMLSLTRNLKEQTLTANKILKRDTETVGKSSNLANQNAGSLQNESKKLDEHSKKACKCWMWLMIGLVMAIFIGMVLFMKIMKKKSW
ncbi:unnamed protein product [Diamesa hyperborea]